MKIYFHLYWCLSLTFMGTCLMSNSDGIIIQVSGSFFFRAHWYRFQEFFQGWSRFKVHLVFIVCNSMNQSNCSHKALLIVCFEILMMKQLVLGLVFLPSSVLKYFILFCIGEVILRRLVVPGTMLEFSIHFFSTFLQFCQLDSRPNCLRNWWWPRDWPPAWRFYVDPPWPRCPASRL